MGVDVSQHSGVHVIRPQEDLTGDELCVLEAVTELLGHGPARIVLDMTPVKFINSAGLGELVRANAQVNMQEGRMVLANPSPFVSGVFETTKLDTFFQISRSLDDAIAKLQF